MATRNQHSFTKRQKERKRQEKAQEKLQRRLSKRKGLADDAVSEDSEASTDDSADVDDFE